MYSVIRMILVLVRVDLLRGFKISDLLKKHTETIRNWLHKASIPDEIEAGVNQWLETVDGKKGNDWAVRSSCVNIGRSIQFAGLFNSRLQVARDKLFQAVNG